MGIRLLGKAKVHSKEKDKDFFMIYVDYPADNPALGRISDKKFVSEEIYNGIDKKMYEKEIDFEWSMLGRYPTIKGVKILN